MTQFFLDSHCHLDDTAFDPDRAAVIERARAAGLRYLLTVGGTATPDQLAASIPIAESQDGIYASVGVHPHESRQFRDAHADEIRKLAAHPKVLAIGEIGLDYYYDRSPRDVQKRVLIQQLELARELKRPVIIHCRDAWADLAAIVETEWRSAARGGILHCFTGTRDDALRFLDWGFLISFAGNITFKNAENLRSAARAVPLDRLLTETDCPYLAPVPYRGKRNEPAFVREVTGQLSALHNLRAEEMGRIVLENFARFFQLAPQ